ncbi:MAG: non-heme iron oxygenase ferredoxin subunit [Candidatus Eremiobacteraeota bacterium]|nr:non-heme iron oxygenase ferredoxin subunit [Candidatus Eremiobacteraeota bacterium]
MAEHRIARASEIVPGSALRAEIKGVEILVCNVEGSFFAIEDVCTHDGAPLDQGVLDGPCITCPRHGAVFDVTTGAAITLPAVVPVMTFPVRVDDGNIYVECG